MGVQAGAPAIPVRGPVDGIWILIQTHKYK